jgi:hypothetical protein
MDRVVLITAKLSPNTQRAQGESSAHAKLPARHVHATQEAFELRRRESWADKSLRRGREEARDPFKNFETDAAGASAEVKAAAPVA